jgi:rhamnosyltransferase
MPVKHPKVVVLLAAYNGMQWIEDREHQESKFMAEMAEDVAALLVTLPAKIKGTFQAIHFEN